MGFLDAIGDVLSGWPAVSMQDKYGPDWRQQRAAKDFALQQQQAEEERNAREFERRQEEADIGGLAEAALAPGETPETLAAYVPPGMSDVPRRMRISRALGRSAQAKSSLESQKAQSRYYEGLLRGEQRTGQITQTAEERRKTDEAKLAGVEGQKPSPRDEAAWAAAMARVAEAVAGRGGGGGGARKPYWNVAERRTDFLTNDELGAAPPGMYTDVTSGRQAFAARTTGEASGKIIKNLDDALTAFEATQQGLGRVTPASVLGIPVGNKGVAWNRYNTALQSAGQMLGRKVLNDARVSNEDRIAYANTIGVTSQLIAEMDPTEARRRFDLLKALDQDYEAKYGAGGGGGGTPPAAAAAGGGTTPRVTSAAEYAALPSGTVYIDPTGKKRRKP